MQEFLDLLIKEKNIMIYGPASTGKTTISLLSAYNQIKDNNKVIFLDTENSFPLERFWQISNNDKALLDNIFLFKAKNFMEQHEKIKFIPEICNKTKISLVIVDSLGVHYRRLVKHKPDMANSMLFSQLRILESLNLPVIITNQVYSDFNSKIKMVGDGIVNKFSKCLIELKKDPRRIDIKNKKELKFEICNGGIKIL